MEFNNKNIFTKYCDDCERIVKLDESGYCLNCGKHADNMKSDNEEIKNKVYEFEHR